MKERKGDPTATAGRQGLAYAALACSAMVWGFIPVMQKQLFAVLTPFAFSFSRFLLSGLIFLAWVMVRDRQGLTTMIREAYRPLLVAMVIGPLPAFVLQSYGIQRISLGLAAVVMALEPVLTYVVAVLMKQERWNARRLASIGIALAGLVLMIRTDRQSPALGSGLAVSVAATTLWAVNTNISKQLVTRYSPMAMMAFTFTLGSLLMMPMLGGHYLDALGQLDTAMVLRLLFCAIPGTVLAFAVWYTSLKHVSPSTVSLSLYLIPIVTTLGGVLWLHEDVGILKVLGLGLALLGMYLVSFRFRE